MGKIVMHNKKLLFQAEVLRARLGIRDFFLKTAVREVYENIGQVLSLVRMQLNFINPDTKNLTVANINESGNLVGQSLKDLRHLCRSFYPDHDIMKSGGFIEALENIIYILEPKCGCAIHETGVRKDFAPGLSLIVFKILQEILLSIKEEKGKCKGVFINYKKDEVVFSIHYTGEMINWKKDLNDNDEGEHLSLPERAYLIKGSLHNHRLKDKLINVELVTPLKDNLYD